MPALFRFPCSNVWDRKISCNFKSKVKIPVKKIQPYHVLVVLFHSASTYKLLSEVFHRAPNIINFIVIYDVGRGNIIKQYNITQIK